MAGFLAGVLQRVRFLLRLLVFALLVMFLCSVNIVHGFILTLITFKTNHMNLSSIYGRVLALGMKVFTSTEVIVEGLEHLEKEHSCIFVSNHQSSLDLLAMMAVWPQNTVAVAKQSVVFMPVFGIAAYLNGTILINRKNSSGAKQQLNAVFQGMVQRKGRIWFFPEGTRNRTSDGMLPFKKGAFFMAIENQVPVVPIVFSSMSDFYSRTEMRWDSGKIRVKALPPVPTTGMSKDDMEDLMKSVSSQMLDTLEQLNGK
ncbi:1-acyl-sn-glycerol-3-phosphate acyltransferase alpha-like [Sycon ciliatum]|uniref:1-acyl-sn-glycerol-3-phosphate acyltransferase alpha-like n=1 Tax=Sycon ciliatum TaxID=27933 RepID=UPI0031F66226